MKSELVIVESHNLQTHLNLTIDLIGSFGKMLMMMSYGTWFLCGMFRRRRQYRREFRARLYSLFFFLQSKFHFYFFNNFVYTYLFFFLKLFKIRGDTDDTGARGLWMFYFRLALFFEMGKFCTSKSEAHQLWYRLKTFY